MNKQLRVSNLVYEMLVEVGKKHRPQLKPEVMIEELVEDAYRSIRKWLILFIQGNAPSKIWNVGTN